MEKMKKEVQKVDFLTENEQKTFNLSKNEALERLKSENITQSEQMLNKWCRDDEIHAVRVAKGAPKNRGLRISEKSLKAFILTKTGKVEELLEEIEILKNKLSQAKKEIKELKNSGIRKPRAKSPDIKEPFLIGDKLSFKLERAKHQAIFKDNELVRVEKNTRTGFIDITEKITEDKKEAIIETKKKLNR